MYDDPSVQLTPRQQATLKWFAAMSQCGQRWHDQEQAKLKKVRAKLAEGQKTSKPMK